MDDKKVVTTVQFPKDRLDRLKKEAADKETSVNNIVNIAVKEHQEAEQEKK